jgi:aminoglycoside phosphotransferase (APT) family kinase protein
MLAVPGTTAQAGLQRAAQALAALHRQDAAASERHRRIDAELARFVVRARRVATLDPVAGAALEELAERLTAAGAGLPRPLGLVHGDCKPSQFLLGPDGSVVLLDLDSCGLADPAGDVGTFLATLRQRGVRDELARRGAPGGAARLLDLADGFLDGYLAASGGADDLRRRARWYEAVALQRKALRSFSRAPRSPMTSALVRSAHTCLDRLGGTA